MSAPTTNKSLALAALTVGVLVCAYAITKAVDLIGALTGQQNLSRRYSGAIVVAAILLGVPIEVIEQKIYVIRGHKVMIDSDLADLYQVLTKNLNLAVRRNIKRFPVDFMFQLTADEADVLRYQIGTSKKGQGGRRYLPYVFTEQGVAMLSSVLNSERAVLVNIEIIRAFVKLRQMLASNLELSRRLDELESKYDKQFRVVFDAIRQLMSTPVDAEHQNAMRKQTLPRE